MEEEKIKKIEQAIDYLMEEHGKVWCSFDQEWEPKYYHPQSRISD